MVFRWFYKHFEKIRVDEEMHEDEETRSDMAGTSERQLLKSQGTSDIF